MEEQVRSSSLRYVSLDGHANSFALNKDNNCIAVAGRSLLKVFSFENDGFTEIHNMRQQPSNNKNHNLSFSSNAIDWSKIDTNILATAATNGCIAIWDLNKFGRQKQLNVYHDHERTTHAVSFHHQDANFLLSASQDSTIKLFDLREKNSCVSTFQSTESVRDVKFNPFNCNSFASVSENGCVHSWDVRRPEKFVQQFTAHSGPIYCLDWHPTNQWLATGSRDKLIKVWNMSNPKPQLEYTIYTIAVVGRVRWRPERKFHIASCSLVVDYSIYIWDVRRPFIPYASFNEHTNVTTDIAFKGAPDTLISTSKDSTIYKHITKDAHHPALSANPQATTISPRGDILFVCKAKIKSQPQVMTTSSTIPKLFKKTTNDTVDGVINAIPSSPSLHEQFHLAKSSLHYFSDDGSNNRKISVGQHAKIDDSALTKTLQKDYNFFTGCAKEYRLKSDEKNFLEMLEHNANVARKYGRPNVSMLWNLVKMIYRSTPLREPTSNPSLNVVNFTTQNSNDSSISRVGSFGTSGLTTNENNNINILDQIGSRENISSTDELLNDPNEFQIPKAIVSSDLEVEVFNDGESQVHQNAIDSKHLRNGFLFTGPAHDKEFPMVMCSSSLINHELMHYNHNRSKEMEMMIADQMQTSQIMPTNDQVVSQSFLSINMPEFQSNNWKPNQVLADCLVLQSEIGDVQTPTCILLCLGKRRRDDLPIDRMIQENFLQSYIDMLHRHQMWNEATEVINMSATWIPNIGEMNEQSTTIHTSCGECGRVINKGWYCKHCKSSDPSRCVVCNEIVKGMFTFCNHCCHGGHLQHMIEWFSQNPRCPKCNHLCEYD
ncbi:hypothetical protein PVAND_014811 [Polypedilum vanderplanki]|uniref:GATOR2 complex protein WDR24 n=1 Tax=Polypedilum vanderplanki TaxID=319348 RepID=A0A9J6BAA3_POLVA|nr:hypothetical protein PVAND_014811 [Polypedilum vanderplanki]